MSRESKKEEKNNDKNKSSAKIILGSMEFGRRLNEEEAVKITIDFLTKTPYREIDSAFMYQGGKTEIYLGNMNKTTLKPNNALIASKANPKYKNGLTEKGVTDQLNISLSRLQSKSIDLFYLHWPDHETDIKTSLETVNELYKKGKFKRFGLSNYSAWQVAEIYYLCKQNNYILPTIYQGMYNCITRKVEDELIPCLRRFNMKFYAYNPLAGGLLSGKHKYEQINDDSIEKGGRFSGQTGWAIAYKKRFWQKSKFDAIEIIRNALIKSYGLNDDNTLKVGLVEASLRWLMRHSILKQGDGVIMGPSTMKYYQQNLNALQCKDDLNEDVVKAIDDAWQLCKGDCPVYFR